MKRVFALIMLLIFISFGSVSVNAFESPPDPACSIPSADGFRQFASTYNIDGISNHTILDNALQVPYEDGDAKDWKPEGNYVALPTYVVTVGMPKTLGTPGM